MDTTLKIEKEKQITASASKVWNILTNPSAIEKWLGTKTTSNWENGSDIVFSFTWEDKEYRDKGTILEFETEKLFSYNYWSVFSGLPDSHENYSVITFQLQPGEGGTLLKLTHHNFASETMYQHSDQNWEESLDKIKALSEE